MPPGPSPLDQKKRPTARVAALRCLTGRDFSTEELKKRLIQRGYEAAEVSGALAGLGAEGILSDARYAESRVRVRVRRGYGAARIARELTQQGISPDSAAAAIKEAGIDWLQLAREALHRRFGVERPADARERARRMRFLQARGFSSEQIRAVVRGAGT